MPTPHYPGIRANVDEASCAQWLSALSPILSSAFDAPEGHWSIQAWHSLVTTSPKDLAPIQHLPHIDGADPDQIAMILYLHKGPHGGTAFYRHRATGYEALTADTFPIYQQTLEREVREAGLPPKAYPSDGAPFFERTHIAEAVFNRAVFYRGNILHSGQIDNAAPLYADPAHGRYTINAFLRPPANHASTQ